LSNDEFKVVLARKCSVNNDLGKMHVAENETDKPRLGISVSKGCGNAVVRNHIKRLVREAFRLEQHNIPAGYDYLLIFSLKMSKKATSAGKNAGRGLTFEEIRRLFIDLVKQGVARCDKN
jgi:ribonuclease P protein component